MRITIAAIGRLKAGPERDLLARYCERIEAIGRSVALTPLRLIELAESRAGSIAARSADEAARLLEKTSDTGFKITLDERGKAMTSAAFAELLRARRDQGVAGIAFLIGGADGHGLSALSAANLTLSLGPMTLPHGLARIVIAEQIYRAATILSGHPYHRV